jgi:hypothetical protein
MAAMLIPAMTDLQFLKVVPYSSEVSVIIYDY